VEVTGCPVRRRILEALRPAAQGKLGLDPSRLTLLVMGGSQGAQRINRAVVGALPELLTRPVQIVHLTGTRDYEQVLSDSAPAAALHEHYFPLPFENDMGPLLAAADVVISRAGSSSLAEASARGCPQILVPYPHAGGHQRANAQALEAAGAAVVLPDEECEPPALLRILTALIADPTRTNEMSRAARRWAAPHAAERLAEGLLALARSEAVGAGDGPQ
jgi:UDP-N-acetylglucosamine--N-acetylmuramyl-(pentapeptide) pyrophosphoryl-undecaprenol N-acetylglucosamine transferase